jgi:hypothetical protein
VDAKRTAWVDHTEHIQSRIAEIVVNAAVSSSREKGGIRDPSSPRRTLILLTITRSLGEDSTFRMSWFMTWGA